MAILFARPASKRADDLFFTISSFLMLLIVIVGFAPSYFLRGAIFAHLPSLLVHVHGAVFSMWITLFVVQSSLVSSGNIRFHRKLGMFGGVLAGLMVILGVLATFGTLRRHAVLPFFFTPKSFLIGNIIGILIFGAFVAIAIRKRNDAKVHKRLIFIANMMLMPPALGRIPFVESHTFLIGLVPPCLLLALFVFDLATWRRPLVVTIVGGLIFMAVNPIIGAVMHTPFADELTVWAQNHP